MILLKCQINTPHCEKMKSCNSQTEKNIFRVVVKFAGSHFREIERQVGLSTGLVKYHLNYLTKYSIIRQEKKENHVRYFPIGFPVEDLSLMSALRSKSARSILIHIYSNKNISHKDITRVIALSPSTVSWHLHKLIKNSMVVSTVNKNSTTYRLAIENQKLMKLLITYKESFFDSLVNKTVETWEFE